MYYEEGEGKGGEGEGRGGKAREGEGGREHVHLSERAIPHIQLSLPLPSLSRLWLSACSGTVIIAWQDRVLSRCHCSHFRSCGSCYPAGRPHRGQPSSFKILTTSPAGLYPACFSFSRVQQTNLCLSDPASGSTSPTHWAENLTPPQASCHLHLWQSPPLPTSSSKRCCQHLLRTLLLQTPSSLALTISLLALGHSISI